ncbi:hypothetical protein AAG906_023631 [Vitis piasezkii]
MAPRRDKKQMDEKEGKQKITSPKRLRGPTLKPEIAKKRSEGLKIDIQYNDDGEGVGEGYGAFLVDENSKNNAISSIGTSFRSFNRVSFAPPTEYNYIPIEDRRKLVANRLSKEFQVKSKKGKERRAKYVYIHRVSRKGYAGLQEELDELTKAVEEGKITCVGQKDILTLALGTLEHPGRVRGKGGKKKPKQFFNTPKPTKTLEEEECQRMLMEKVKSLEEEIIALKVEKEPSHPAQVSSTNIRKQLLQHEEIGGRLMIVLMWRTYQHKGLKSFSTNSYICLF